MIQSMKPKTHVYSEVYGNRGVLVSRHTTGFGDIHRVMFHHIGRRPEVKSYHLLRTAINVAEEFLELGIEPGKRFA